jgi:hypothetical protein
VYLNGVVPPGPLEQGDICVNVPLPVLAVKMELYSKGSIVQVTREELEQAFQLFVVPPMRGPAIVLSQSCDLERAERDENVRILVAPIIAEEGSQLLVESAEAIAKTVEKGTLAKALQHRSDSKPPKELKNLQDRARKRHIEALKSLWSGQDVGCFPIKKIESGAAIVVPRSLVYFSYAVSVPVAVWLEYLKSKRVARLNETWRSVLQESLRDWLGRFAYPDTDEERLRVGLQDELIAEKPADAAPAAQPAAAQPVPVQAAAEAVPKRSE